MYVIGVRQFVGKEVDTLPTILVSRLNDHVFSPIADCAGCVLGLTRMKEIGVLPVKGRIHGDDFVCLFKRTLIRISGVDIKA